MLFGLQRFEWVSALALAFHVSKTLLVGWAALYAPTTRSDALRHFGEILKATDGIMVARGDLGVEVPSEEMAILQKQLIAQASLAGKPVITATQMLESMVSSRLPTRAESTDVANAILDGTDCIMLSGESAMGKYPEEAVTMLAKIAACTEAYREAARSHESRPGSVRRAQRLRRKPSRKWSNTRWIPCPARRSSSLREPVPRRG